VLRGLSCCALGRRARFLTVWICTLPLALYRNFQFASPLVSAVIAFLLIGVENIGVQVRPRVRVMVGSGFLLIGVENIGVQARPARRGGPGRPACGVCNVS